MNPDEAGQVEKLRELREALGWRQKGHDRLAYVLLGMGADGHTASLIPGDPVLEVNDRDVALTDPVNLYQNRRRMTLTYPMINRSRQIMWLATGAEKVPMIVKLKAADPTIPGGRIAQENALLLTDTTTGSG